MSKILTLGDFRKMTQNLDDDFKIEFRVRIPLTEEQLRQMPYPYPYDTLYFEGFNFDDVGYSDREACFGVDLDKHKTSGL